MKAIETIYKGYKFRSRLEARWAVFFDVLDIKWEYELQGYVFTNEICYLPDFWLPTFSGGMFVEVKPIGGDFSKAYQLAVESNKPVWLAEGTPDFMEQKYYDKFEDKIELITGIPNICRKNNEMYVIPGFCNKDGTFDIEYTKGSNYENAVYKAKQVRFEFGETPK